MKEISVKKAKQICDKGNCIMLDVREKDELTTMIKGAINIPLDKLQTQLNKLQKNKSILVNCRSGVRSQKACKILDDAGFKSFSIKGGIIAWENEKLPVE